MCEKCAFFGENQTEIKCFLCNKIGGALKESRFLLKEDFVF